MEGDFAFASFYTSRSGGEWPTQKVGEQTSQGKDRLQEAQHRPCRVVTGGTGNGCAGQHRLQEGAVTVSRMCHVPVIWASRAYTDIRTEEGKSTSCIPIKEKQH